MFVFKIQDSKPDVKTAVKMAKQAYGADSPKVEVARKMVTTCGAKITHTDRCEMAAEMYSCALEESKSHGYEFSDFM